MGRKNKNKSRIIPEQNRRICGSICLCQMIMVFSCVSIVYLSVAIYMPSYKLVLCWNQLCHLGKSFNVIFLFCVLKSISIRLRDRTSYVSNSGYDNGQYILQLGIVRWVVSYEDQWFLPANTCHYTPERYRYSVRELYSYFDHIVSPGMEYISYYLLILVE